MLSSLPSVFPFSPQSSSRYSQEHKKTVPFFQKKRKLERKRKQKKRKNAKSQFWLRITRKVDATGRDFGCKFRLRRSPGASESAFRPILARFLANFHFFSYFVGNVLYGLVSIRPVFPRFPFFAFGVLMCFFYKNAFSIF